MKKKKKSRKTDLRVKVLYFQVLSVRINIPVQVDAHKAHELLRSCLYFRRSHPLPRPVRLAQRTSSPTCTPHKGPSVRRSLAGANCHWSVKTKPYTSLTLTWLKYVLLYMARWSRHLSLNRSHFFRCQIGEEWHEKLTYSNSRNVKGIVDMMVLVNRKHFQNNIHQSDIVPLQV